VRFRSGCTREHWRKRVVSAVGGTGVEETTVRL
jgi:hypothetical protein